MHDYDLLLGFANIQNMSCVLHKIKITSKMAIKQNIYIKFIATVTMMEKKRIQIVDDVYSSV